MHSRLNIPTSLAAYGVTAADLDSLVEAGKGSPGCLTTTRAP
jgi:alcohol dehydrogenase class IV